MCLLGKIHSSYQSACLAVSCHLLGVLYRSTPGTCAIWVLGPAHHSFSSAPLAKLPVVVFLCPLQNSLPDAVALVTYCTLPPGLCEIMGERHQLIRFMGLYYSLDFMLFFSEAFFIILFPNFSQGLIFKRKNKMMKNLMIILIIVSRDMRVSDCNICHPVDCQVIWLARWGPPPPSVLHLHLSMWKLHAQEGDLLKGQGCLRSCIPLLEPPNELSDNSI